MKYTKAVAGVIALLLASSVESTGAVQVEHRHRHHHHGKAQRDQSYVALDSAQEQKELARQQGILDKVKAKIEKEEQEKKQILIAKTQAEIQQNAIQEAQIIENNKRWAHKAAQQDMLAQANVLVSQIKDGTVNAQQLASIMMGQLEAPSAEDSQALPQTEDPGVPVAGPIAAVLLPEPMAHEPVTHAQEPQPPKQTVKQPPKEQKPAPKAAEAVAPKPAEPKKEAAPQKPVPAAAEEGQENAGDLEGSVAVLAERLARENRHNEEQHTEEVIRKFNEAIAPEAAQVQAPAATKPLTMTERAEQKFKSDAGEVKAQLEESLDNPISQYFAGKHPEVLAEAQERHYLTDHI